MPGGPRSCRYHPTAVGTRPDFGGSVNAKSRLVRIAGGGSAPAAPTGWAAETAPLRGSTRAAVAIAGPRSAPARRGRATCRRIRAAIDRDSGPTRLDRGAAQRGHCIAALSRIIASSGSTCSAAGGHGRSADRQAPPGSAARTLLPVRARGVPRRPSRVPPGPATSRDTGRRCPRRHRRVSVRGATGRIADSPCSGPLPGRAHQIKRPLVAIHHEGSRSEGLIPLGEAGSP